MNGMKESGYPQRVGCDLVHIPTFTKRFSEGGDLMLDHVFLESELATFATEESRAGIFAAKEACMKAGVVAIGAWKEVVLTREESGKPHVIEHAVDVSISHEGEYALAVALAL